jgi:hypothetical protein
METIQTSPKNTSYVDITPNASWTSNGQPTHEEFKADPLTIHIPMIQHPQVSSITTTSIAATTDVSTSKVYCQASDDHTSVGLSKKRTTSEYVYDQMCLS